MTIQDLRSWFPHLTTPIIFSAPMRLLSSERLALAVSRAGGLGFIGAGYDFSNLDSMLSNASSSITSSPIPTASTSTLPIGVGAILWNVDHAEQARFMNLMRQYKPCAIWLFAPKSDAQMDEWIGNLRQSSPNSKVVVQVGTVAEAVRVYKDVDILVVQGYDAGGHGTARTGSIISLVPEVLYALSMLGNTGSEKIPPVVATGGIVSGAATVAALALGADGVAIGTKLLAATESDADHALRAMIVGIKDGGKNTVRTRLYDDLRGSSGWPQNYNGRAYINDSYLDAESGVKKDVLLDRYKVAERENDLNRLAVFVGTGVGLVIEVKTAEEIIVEIQKEADDVIARLSLTKST
ncbi:2-nitropropane dioxygenase [Lipomyces starkeyi]